MNNPFPWFGSKARLAKWIIHLMPSHEGYAEIFGGTGAVLLNKSPSKIEIFNDINEGITTFFKVVRNSDKLKELKKKLQLTLFNEKDYKEFKKSWHLQKDEVEKAYQWYYVAQLSFSGIFGKGPRFATTASMGGMATPVASYLNSIENLDKVFARMRGVQILNRSWKKCLNLFDLKDFLIYLDPPYVPESRIDGEYPNEMTIEDHEELVEAIRKSKAMVILSGYKTKLYDSLLKSSWKEINKTAKNICSHKSNRNSFTKSSRMECLYFNQKIAAKIS